MLTRLFGNHGAHERLKEAISHQPTGNAMPILSEILAALEALVSGGEATVIDLGALPFSAGDERVLDEILGAGEVRAVVDVLGESLVQETAVPGVWRVDHYGPDGAVQSRFIEVTLMPEVLRTQPEDARRGLGLLAERLRERNDTT